MKIGLFICLLLGAGTLQAQDFDIPGNPYDAAGKTIQRSNAFKRERWFFEQRMFPFDTIPADARAKALHQRDEMRRTAGFHLDNSSTWTNIGPTSGYYFSYGNISSRVATIKYDPSNPNTVYLGAAFGGVWKSTNSGATWVAKADNEVSLASGALAIDPTNTNIVYYGTGEATYSAASYYGRGLLKSTNGGESWTNYTSGLPSSTYFSRLVVRPNQPSQLLAALGTSGLYRSTNGGVSWSSLVSGRCDDVVFSPSGDTAYITGSGTGYRISTNGGQSFSANGALSMQTRNHIAICKSAPSILYVSKYAGDTITVFKSTNAGTSFTQVAAGTNFSGGQAWYDFYVHVNPFDPNYVYIGSIDIWRSTNGGTSFQNITNGYGGGNVHVDQQNLDFHPTDSNRMFCSNDGGVWLSTNRGTSWTNLNSSLTLTQFYRIAADPSNASHVLGGTQDNGTQRTTGTPNWTAAFGGDGGEVCFQSQNPSNILGETQNNGVYRSTNGGASWTSSTTGLTGSGTWVGPIISHPDSVDVFYTARQDVFKSTNKGANWFSISSGTSGTIREMAISKSDARVMFATSGSTIYRSTNRGYTWTSVTSGLPGRTITSVQVHPDSSNVVLVTFSGFGAGKVYRSTNTGTTWSNISGNLPDTPVNDVLIYYPGVSTNSYLVATDVGVFLSTNLGSTWTELADGLPNTVAIHLDYNQSSGLLRVGTHGRGVFETRLGEPTLAILIPNGGEQWPIGSVQTIRWNTSALSGNVRIELSRNGGTTFSETIFSSTANDGMEDWTITGPSTAVARIRVTSLDNPSLADTSEANFSIVQASVSVIAPNGGELWPAPSIHSIQWNSSYVTGNVKIELSRNGGSTYETLFAATPNDGVESWLTTPPATAQALIRISSLANPSVSDVSNATFAINSLYALSAMIQLRDNGGVTDTLEFGTAMGATDSLDILYGELELPPLPPGDAFDVRWRVPGSQGTKRDLRDTLGGARVQAVYTGMLQAGVGGYPFHLKWNRNALPAGSFVLRDEVSGGNLFYVNMKEADSMVIADPAFSTFQLVYSLGSLVSMPVAQGWNMISLPLTTPDRRKTTLFPTSVSSAFSYSPPSYIPRDTLEYGTGYWLKFPSLQAVDLWGELRLLDTIPVALGWNLIGSISGTVPIDSITQIPPGIVGSNYWKFEGGAYNAASMIEPMRAYWVKALQNGKLILKKP